MLESVRSQSANKRDGPARSIQYFEPGIASAIAKARAPLPNVIEIPAKTVEVQSGKTNGIIAAADSLIDTIDGWGTPGSFAVGRRADPPPVRLLPQAFQS